jgi:PAS domain S-box-containing protein
MGKTGKQNESRMSESAGLAQALMRCTGTGIYIVQDGMFQYVNSLFQELAGYTEQELLGVYYLDLVHPDDREAVREKAIENLKGHRLLPYEYRFIRKNGEVMWVLERLSSIEYRGKRAAVGSFMDITERKGVEEVLAGEAIRRRILVDQSRDGILVINEDGKVYEANQRFAEMLGYSSEEVHQLYVWDWDTQFAREELVEMGRRVNKTGAQFETRYCRKDGTVFDVEVSINAAVVAGQKLVFSMCRDITERKRAEEALADEATRRRVLIDQSRDGIFVLDENGKVYEANQRFGEMLGYSPEGVLQLHMWDFDAQRTSEELLKMARDVNDTGSHLESRFRRKDGTVFDVEISASGAIYAGHKLSFCVCRDITERKQLEEALRESEERYRFLVELSPEAIFVASEGKHVFVNSAGLKLLGASSPDQIIGKPVADFIHPDYREIVTERMRKAMEAGIAPPVMEEKFVRFDGTAIDVEVRAAPLVYQGKMAMQAVVSDITEHKRAEEERGQFERKAQIASRLASVGEMAAGIAHEINNPLTSVIGYSQLLSGREDIPEDVKMDLKAIDEGAQRVAGIIKRLLTFARQSRPERTLVSIDDLITNTLDLRAYHLRTNNIKVTTKLAADLPLTTADPAQLQQVFLNIIVNAEAEMKQARGRGKLLIKTEEVNGTIRISFKDNGHGIAKENLARIFDPFFTTREVDQGTGLGLSICHGIIAEHKGRIWAESRLGRGATFIVELPIATEDRQPVLLEPAVEEPKKVTKRPRY